MGVSSSVITGFSTDWTVVAPIRASPRRAGLTTPTTGASLRAEPSIIGPMQRFCRFLSALITKFMLLAAAVLSLAACATAPVQEMSDARQAIRSAEAVGAARRSPDRLSAAQRLLREAQAYLETGAYDQARRYALDARAEAIKARENATQPAPAQSPTP